MGKISSLKAIRLKFMDCMAQNRTEFKYCGALSCPLWKFRLGKLPIYEKGSERCLLLTHKEFVGLENMKASQIDKVFKERLAKGGLKQDG